MNSRQLYLRILTYFRPHLGTALITALCIGIASLTDVLLISQLETVINALLPGSSAFGLAQSGFLGGLRSSLQGWIGALLSTDAKNAALWAIPAVILLLAFMRMLASFGGEYGGAWLTGRVQHAMRADLFGRVLCLPNRYFDNHATGLILSRIAFDVGQVTQAGLNVLTSLIRDSVAVCGYLYVMFSRDWQLALLCLGLVPFIALIVRAAGKRMRRLGLAAQTSQGELTSVLDEAIGGQRIVKIFGGQAFEHERFGAVSTRVRQLGVKQAATAALNSGLIMLLIGILLAAIIYFALHRAQVGALSAGGFVAFMSALLAVQAPVKSLSKLNEPLQRGLAAAQSVFGLMDESAEPDTGQATVGRAAGQLSLRQVSFSYQSDAAEKPALHALNLDIAPGETVALVGSSGSGKTTLASLLPRFYEPTSGQILLDGVDIRTITLQDLRRQIALVSQDVVLFNETLAANIAYGDPAPDQQRIVAAAQAAYADEFIERMPQGYQTRIGENGTRLSGGQRQRLAIARAIYKDAPILILDEATSALDSESERQVQAALELLMRGRTTLVIAHRLSTIEKADRIVVLAGGQVLESGKHAALLAADGAYAALHRAQFRHKEPA